MKAQLKLTSFFTLLLFFAATTVFGQQKDTDSPKKEDKKIVIVKKKVDKDGNVTIEKMVKKGADADNVQIIEGADGEKIIVKEVIVEDGGDDDVRIIKMNGDDTDEGLKEINVDVDDKGDHKKIKIIMDRDGEGEHEVIEWEGEEMPEELIKELQEKNIFIHEGNGDGEHTFNVQSLDMDNGNKACLGVMIGKTKEVENINGEETITIEGESDQGVAILDIIDDSGAQEAGLLKDDVITSINGSTVASIEDVLSILNTAEPGQTVAVAYLRNDQPAQVNATLKQCAAKASNKMIWINEDGNEIEIDEDNDWEFKDEEGNETKMKKRIMIIKESEEDGEETTNEFTFEPVEAGENTLDLEEIDLYPNPTEENLTVSFRAPAVPTTVRIVDISGKEVYNSELLNFDGTFKKEINLGKAAKGALVLTIQQGDKVFTEKIVLQ